MKITKCPPMPARGLMTFNGLVFPKTAGGGQVRSDEDTAFSGKRNWTPWVQWKGKKKKRKAKVAP